MTIPNLNDGNVDRLRIRIQDSNGRQILDDRLPSPDSLTQTSYTAPTDLIDHNGMFHGQVLVEGFDPFIRSRTFEPFIVEGVGVGGDPVATTGTFNFRDFRGANSVNFSDGDLTAVGVVRSSYRRVSACRDSLHYRRDRPNRNQAAHGNPLTQQ